MSLRKSPEISEKLLAANRRNAQKSTGPRTSEGKRRASHLGRHSYATPNLEAFRQMTIVGDEPELLGRLERDLTEAWQPSNAMQALIVADLAMLYFKKAALERTLRLKRMLEVQQLVVATEDHMLGRDVIEPPIDDVFLRRFGYRGVEPCQRAFAESQRLLDLLQAHLEELDWNVAPIMKALYGESPTVPAENIQRLFRALAAAEKPNGADANESTGADETEATRADGTEPSGDNEIDSTGADGTEAVRDDETESTVAELKRLIAEEKRASLAEEEAFRRDQESIYNLRLGFHWAPITANWGTALQKDRMLDSAIDAKAKLLMRLQGRRASGRRGSAKKQRGR